MGQPTAERRHRQRFRGILARYPSEVLPSALGPLDPFKISPRTAVCADLRNTHWVWLRPLTKADATTVAFIDSRAAGLRPQSPQPAFEYDLVCRAVRARKVGSPPDRQAVRSGRVLAGLPTLDPFQDRPWRFLFLRQCFARFEPRVLVNAR